MPPTVRTVPAFAPLAAIALLAALASPGPGRCVETVPTGFVVEAVVDSTGLVNPIAFTFLPDGRILLLEHLVPSVRIAAVGTLASVHVLNVPNVSSSAFERGVLGIAVDPAWPARPYVYLSYTHVDETCYLTMYTATGDLTNPSSTNLQLVSPFHLLTDVADAYDVHNGSSVRFGPDGMLYVSYGDDSNACTAQDVTSLTGKILRLDVSGMPLPGSGPPPKSAITPPDNPFPGPNANERLVWAWGLRNPFRFTIDPGTGDLYIGDVGEAAFEEIDRRTGTTAFGSNFGWPRREGFDETEFTCDVKNVYTDPIFVYPHGFFGQAIIGGPFYRADGSDPFLFPAGYQESVFFAEFYDGWVRRIVKSGSSWVLAPPVPGQPTPANWATDFSRVADFQMGPDGALYLLRFTGVPRGIQRIRPTTSTNAPPSLAALPAPFTAYPNPARVGEIVTLRGRVRTGEPTVLRIVDLGGRRLRTLVGTPGANGSATYVWDGRDDGGALAAAGVYFVRGGSGGEAARSGPIVRLR